MLTDQEKKLLVECMADGVKCAIDTVYETLSMLFENMAKHPELTLQQILMAMSITLNKLVEESANEKEIMKENKDAAA